MSRLVHRAILAALVAGACGAPEAAGPRAEQALPAFEEITATAGIGDFRHVTGARGDYWFPETMGSGAAFFRLDDDDLPDLVLAGGGAWDPASGDTLRAARLFRNLGGGRFAGVRDAALEGLTGYTFGIVAADYDNDGDQDLLVTTLGPDVLLRNDPDGFTDVTEASGLPADASWSTAATFFDADGDGWLDLYVGRYVAWSPDTDIFCSQDGENKGYCTPELYRGLGGRYFRNRGDGTFEDRTEAAGFAGAHGKTLGVLAFDFDRDGDTDLVTANDTEPDELWINQGDGTFVESGVVSGIAFDERGRARAGMGVDAGVVDRTGEETLFVGNFSSEMIGVYRHLGNDVFLDRAASSRIGRSSLLTLTFGLVLVDVDLDGDLDLLTANGHVQPHIERVKDNVKFRQPPHLYLNDGDGTFGDVAGELGGAFARPMLARGAVWADVDADGDPDLLLTTNGGPVHLLANTSDGGAIRVRLQGTRSNRDGIGARVVLWAGGRSQERFVRSGGSYLSQSQLDPLFGLAQAPGADSIVVRWPSGAVTRVGPTPAGSVVRITE